MTRVSIHQPQYLPWLGLCDKIFKSDTFVLLDHVQFMSRGFQHRTLYSNRGASSYLSLSVNDKGVQHEHIAIRDITLKSSTSVLQKHIDLLRNRYKKASNYIILEQLIEEILKKEWDHLALLAHATMKFTLNAFLARPRWAVSSTMCATTAKSELMADLTRAVGGQTYLSGRGAEAYVDESHFTSRGVDLSYQTFVHPSYLQEPKMPFVAGCFALELAILDKGYLDTLRRFYSETNQLSELRCVEWR